MKNKSIQYTNALASIILIAIILLSGQIASADTIPEYKWKRTRKTDSILLRDYYKSIENFSRIPNVTNTLNDVFRLHPTAKTDYKGNVHFASKSNQYMAFEIDGVNYNDNFGLSKNALPLGFGGFSPISTNFISELKMQTTGFDVSESGGTAMYIGAKLKRGGENLHAEAYHSFVNQKLSGKLDRDLTDFLTNNSGFQASGKIIKNRLYFFTAADYNYQQFPSSYEAKNDDKFRNEVLRLYNRLDLKVSKATNFQISYIFAQSTGNIAYQSTPETAYSKDYSLNYGGDFHSVTASLKTTRPIFEHELRLNYQYTNDYIDTTYSYFNSFTTYSENTSTGGQNPEIKTDLHQRALSFVHNLRFNFRKHVVTIGSNHRLSQINYLTLYKTQNSIYNNMLSVPNTSFLERYYLLTNAETGELADPEVKFRFMRSGFYIQNKYRSSPRFYVTGGFRIDLPVYLSEPDSLDNFSELVAEIEQQNIYKLKGAKSGKLPLTLSMLSPRINFSYFFDRQKKLELRGAAGVYNNRMPLSQIAGQFVYNGNIYGNRSGFSGVVLPSKLRIELITRNYSFSQDAKYSLSLHKKFKNQITAMVKGIFSRVFNESIIYNINYAPSDALNPEPTALNSDYSDILLLANTDKGHSYQIIGEISKSTDYGLSTFLSYSYGVTKNVTDYTEVDNLENWQNQTFSKCRNDMPLGISGFSSGHLVKALVSYKFKIRDYLSTIVSVFYNGQSGQRYSYTYFDLSKGKADTYRLVDLPENPTDINFITYNQYVPYYTDDANADEQREKLVEFVNSHNGLEFGNTAKRNAATLNFQHIFDLKLAQNIHLKAFGAEHLCQISVDFFNVGNLINNTWGRIRFVENGVYPLLHVMGTNQETGEKEYTYRYENQQISTDYYGFYNSLWHARLGIKYRF